MKPRHIEDDIDLLNTTLVDSGLQENSEFLPGDIWKPLIDRASSYIRKVSLKNFRSLAVVCEGYGDAAVMNPLELRPLNFKTRALSKITVLPFISDLVGDYQKRLKKATDKKTHYQSLYYSLILGDWYKKFQDEYGPLPDTLLGNPSIRIKINGQTLGHNYVKQFPYIHT
jgi:hypothetical protein